MQHRAAVGAVAVTSVAEGPERILVGREGLPRNFRRLAQDHHHEGAHQESRIRLFVVTVRRVVEKLNVAVALIRKKSTEFANEFVHRGQIERAKVRVKRFIYKFLCVCIIDMSVKI